MNPTWFGSHWCYIGLAVAVALLPILFAANMFRQLPNPSGPRDPVWLPWLSVATYIIHQFEEYGFSATAALVGGRICKCAAAPCRI